MKIMSIVGARPQFVKLAPMVEAFSRAGLSHGIIHTGQHYDKDMSEVFFSELSIPRPDCDLGVGSGTHGRQTGAMLVKLDEVLEVEAPDCVLVYGDTNSTLAGALAATKLHIPVAHLEAGLRSFNRGMPEELNRVATDHLVDLCLAPTEAAVVNLNHEGLAERSVLVGDVMTDVLLTHRKLAEQTTGASLPEILNGGEYRVATLHRPENTDNPQRLRRIVEALSALAEPTLLVAHPRLAQCAQRAGIDLGVGTTVLAGPMSYMNFIGAVASSVGVITDSGGLQKEAFLLRVPCTSLRRETEWTETVELGWNVLVAEPELLQSTLKRPLPAPTDAAPYGDGHAADRSVDAIVRTFGTRVKGL